MQENRENDASGILFTDFAGIAPETESPSESSPQPSPQPPPQPPLVSLEAIASALDIDFEDDDGWTTPAQQPPAVDPAQPPPATPASSAPAAAAAPAPPPPDDELLSLSGAAAIPVPLSPASAPASAPSWADFARAFQTGSAPTPPASPPAGPPAASSASPVSSISAVFPSPAAPAAPVAAASASAADLFFRAARAPAADGMQVAFVDYRPLPGEAGAGFGPAVAGAGGGALATFAADDGDDMDILSLLPPLEEGAGEADFAGTFDDNFDANSEAGSEAGAGGEADSSGPAGAGGSRRPPPPTGPWRGGRLGVAPARETPYGGLERLDEWFRPPPAAGDPAGPAATARRDWFVPPDKPPQGASAQPPAARSGPGAGAGSAAARAAALAKTDVFDPVPPADEEAPPSFAEDAPRPPARPAEPAEGNREAPAAARIAGTPLDAGAGHADSGLADDAGDMDSAGAADDIFADFDLEQAWTQKAAERASRPATAVYDAQEAPDGPDGTGAQGASAGAGSRPGTRYVDMFSGVDLEEAWREKQRKRKDTAIHKKEEAARAAFSTGADTLVIPASAFDNHDTIIMPAGGFDLPDLPPAPEVAAARKSVRKKKKKAPPLTPGLSGGDDALGFLDDLDSFLDDDAEEDAAPEASAGEAGKKSRGSELPRSLEELEIGDLISPEEESAVAAAARTGGAVSGEDDYFPAGRVIGGDSPTGEVISGSVPGGGGATVDDIIGQVKPGADATVNDSISAPEIDDSLIDTEVPPGTMDEIEAELEAEAAAKAAGEGGETADGEAGGGEENGGDDAAEPAVPVDPAAALAAFDDMDFSGLDDLLDDETKAMLEEDAAEDAGMAEGEAGDADADAAAETAGAAGPGGFAGLRQKAVRLAKRALPINLINKAKRMIAWRENWWFYCDLFAAVVASASLAVIFSYFMWYRE